MSKLSSNPAFPTTSWTMFDVMNTAAPNERREMINDFLCKYWQPMAFFVAWKFKNLSPMDVEDIVQGFTADRLIQADILQHAQSGKGRLRSFLQKSLERYAIDQHRKSISRGKYQTTQEADSATTQDASSSNSVLDIKTESTGDICVFDIQWARQIVAEAASATKTYWQGLNRIEVWRVLQFRCLYHLEQKTEPVDYEIIQEELKISTTELKQLLPTAKRSYARILRQIVGTYVPEEEVDLEIASLSQALRAAESHPELNTENFSSNQIPQKRKA